jgi:hypothetical protein
VCVAVHCDLCYAAVNVIELWVSQGFLGGRWVLIVRILIMYNIVEYMRIHHKRCRVKIGLIM